MSMPVNGSSLEVVGLADRVAFSESTLLTDVGEEVVLAGLVLGVLERDAPVSLTAPTLFV
jgi:hypothetical protein